MKERAYPVYTVNKHAEGLLVGGHPWVYENDILHSPENEPENGTLADVVSTKGSYLGTGFVSLKSKIRVRLISRNANDTFDAAFWRRRVEYAWIYRKTVLDCFTHTGSFALNAAAGGAARVTAADISAEAIAMAQRNAQRNGLTNMDFLCEDTFELLPRLEREGHPYDFIILDPPAFTKARRTVENAMRGYKEINYRAMKLLPRGGYLATASCSHFATEELFIKMLRAAAKDAHRQLRQIEVKQQAPDHPILWGVPETNYLKFFLFQVI